MAEVHLDPENVFHAFGWEPAGAIRRRRRGVTLRQAYRLEGNMRDHLRFFGVDTSQTAFSREELSTTATSVVAAMMDWVQRWVDRDRTRLGRRVEYGNPKHPAVKVVRPILARSPHHFEHVDVGSEPNAADDEFLRRRQVAGWPLPPYVVGSADGRMVKAAVEAAVAGGFRCALVLPPDNRESFARQLELAAEGDPQLRHLLDVAEHPDGDICCVWLDQVWVDWTRQQSREGALRAPQDDDLDPWRGLRWAAGLADRVPSASPEAPLSSVAWSAAAADAGIPAEAVEVLRGQLPRLFGTEPGCDVEVGIIEGTGVWPGVELNWDTAVRTAFAAVVPASHRALRPPDELSAGWAFLNEATVRLDLLAALLCDVPGDLLGDPDD